MRQWLYNNLGYFFCELAFKTGRWGVGDWFDWSYRIGCWFYNKTYIMESDKTVRKI